MTGALIRALRPSHWTKNLLILLPAALAHRAPGLELVSRLSLAFAAFSLVASGGYLVNDLLDRAADGQHPTKRHRPIASGEVGTGVAAGLAALLLVLGLGASWWLSPGFAAVTLGYVILSVGYSRWFKTIAVVDIFLLAAFYTLRLLAGGQAAQVPLSSWLLSFSTFFFLSLAVLKRYGAVRALADGSGSEPRRGLLRRGYEVGDDVFLLALGLGTGVVAGLVLALYLDSPAVAGLYETPELLWLVVPLVMFWLVRFWFHSHRGRVHDDPIYRALRDPVSYAVGVVVLLVMLLAVG